MKYTCGKCGAVIEVEGSHEWAADALRRSLFNRLVAEHDELHPSQRMQTR